MIVLTEGDYLAIMQALRDQKDIPHAISRMKIAHIDSIRRELEVKPVLLQRQAE